MAMDAYPYKVVVTIAAAILLAHAALTIAAMEMYPPDGDNRPLVGVVITNMVLAYLTQIAPYAIGANISALKLGGQRHTATLIGAVEAIALAAQTGFNFAIAKLALVDSWVWVLGLQLLTIVLCNIAWAVLAFVEARHAAPPERPTEMATDGEGTS